MGAAKSKPVAVESPPPTEVHGKRSCRVVRTLPPELTPTAGVIGGGLPGLFIARELSLLGFDVTVIDASPGTVTGSASHCIGAYGSMLPMELAPWSVSLFREWVRGLRSRSESPIITSDLSPLRLLDRVAWNWIYHRLRATPIEETTRSEVLARLKQRTAEIMDSIISDHPSLSEHILHRPVQEKASDEPTIIDVPGWMGAFAGHLADEYNVKFMPSRNVFFSQFKLAFDEESIHHIHARNKDGEIEAHHFDLFVFATGKKTTRLIWPNYTAPVLEMGGCSIDLPLDAPLAQQLSKPYGTSSAAHGLVRWGLVRDSAKNFKLRISGLWNPNLSSSAATSEEWITYILTRKGQLQEASAKGAPIDVRKLLPENMDDVRTARFSRGFTPDGLPIISRIGKCYNGFVLTGFGDDVVPLAAGSANLLARMIVKMAPIDATNPFTLHRFKTTVDFKADDDIPAWQDRLMNWETNTAYLTIDSFINIGKLFGNLLPDQPKKIDAIPDEQPWQRRMRLKEERRNRERREEEERLRQQNHVESGSASTPSAQ